MRVSLEWLKDFVEIKAEPSEVAARLTMAGLEIEGIESVEGDTVFEVNVTPNRPDCLSILGVAREVAAAFGLKLKLPDTQIKAQIPASDFSVEIDDPKLCRRYTGRLINDIIVGDSPEWIKKRLEKSGLRPVNSIVDITNYMLLEFGHPLHAFDADKISGRIIRVAKAGKNSKITTLDGADRVLPEDSLLIWDSEGPVAIAGIMGGEGSSVTNSTKNIFLESAYFAPFSIRRTSKELSLRSESSYRFERGTDIEFLESALNRSALMIRDICGGKIHEIVDNYPEKYIPRKIEVRYKKINDLLGTGLRDAEMLEILNRIGIKTEDRGDHFTAYPPVYRSDINKYEDLVEEIARIFGYNNIPARRPKAALSAGILNLKEIRRRKIREAMRKSGFSEVVNYSFMNPADLDILALPENDERKKCIAVMNPLRQEESLMRTTLVPSMINNFLYNLSHGIRNIRLFEIARIFIDKGEQLPSERLRLGGIYFKEEDISIWKDKLPSFFVAKGSLQALFDELKITGLSFVPSVELFLHKGKSADILINGKNIGFMGDLSPDVVGKIGLKIHNPEIVVFELDVDLLMTMLPDRTKYSQIPKYPSIERDISIVMRDDITSGSVLEYIKSCQAELIESVELFDYYKGGNLPQNSKSLGFRIVYRAKDKTLTENEVETLHQSLVQSILVKTGGELRG
ncbi:MAG: phenylalanine--tRNA ligase subunit beta [Nitrospirae bacterium GWC2_42_7]|nr:MAG: phenylalanine--tRNA ligase subunit beta [Nitrospirae bacterium GWC2_42_7]